MLKQFPYLFFFSITFNFSKMKNTNQPLEIWKDIPNYEGHYQVSNLGSVKSLERIVFRNGKYPFLQKERILKMHIGNKGYFHVVLCKEGKVKTRRIHQLVAEAFLNHKPCGYKLVINHINFNRVDNGVENLEIVTQRENGNFKHLKNTSKYVGVYWNKNQKKWMSRIFINNKRIYLGCFKDELDAHSAYEKALKEHSQNA